MIAPEADALRLAEMRRLQRQMKGVKLQYIAEDDTVFFDDVAGIGEAKVTVLALPALLMVVLYGVMWLDVALQGYHMCWYLHAKKAATV